MQRKSQQFKRFVRANAMRHYRQEQRRKVTAQHRNAKLNGTSCGDDSSVTSQDLVRERTLKRPYVPRPAEASSMHGLVPAVRADQEVDTSATSEGKAHGSPHVKEGYGGQPQWSYSLEYADPRSSWGLGLQDLCSTSLIGGCSISASYTLHYCKRSPW